MATRRKRNREYNESEYKRKKKRRRIRQPPTPPPTVDIRPEVESLWMMMTNTSTKEISSLIADYVAGPVFGKLDFVYQYAIQYRDCVYRTGQDEFKSVEHMYDILVPFGVINLRETSITVSGNKTQEWNFTVLLLKPLSIPDIQIQLLDYKRFGATQPFAVDIKPHGVYSAADLKLRLSVNDGKLGCGCCMKTAIETVSLVGCYKGTYMDVAAVKQHNEDPENKQSQWADYMNAASSSYKSEPARQSINRLSKKTIRAASLVDGETNEHIHVLGFGWDRSD
jgi:hypothetical protein